MIGSQGAHKTDKQSVSALVSQMINKNHQENKEAQHSRHVHATQRLRCLFEEASESSQHGMSDPSIFAKAMQTARVIYPRNNHLPHGHMPKEEMDSSCLYAPNANPLRMPLVDIDYTRHPAPQWAYKSPENGADFWSNEDRRLSPGGPNAGNDSIVGVRNVALSGNLFPKASRDKRNPTLNREHVLKQARYQDSGLQTSKRDQEWNPFLHQDPVLQTPSHEREWDPFRQESGPQSLNRGNERTEILHHKPSHRQQDLGLQIPRRGYCLHKFINQGRIYPTIHRGQRDPWSVKENRELGRSLYYINATHMYTKM